MLHESNLWHWRKQEAVERLASLRSRLQGLTAQTDTEETKLKVRGESKVSITHKIELELSDEELLDLRRAISFGTIKRKDTENLPDSTWNLGSQLLRELPTPRNLET